MAKEHIPFAKYTAIHELEERHEVDIGETYKNRDSTRNFVHYIAESQRQAFKQTLQSCHFFSVLMDGSTDKGHIENELFVILYCQADDRVQEMQTCTRYHCVIEPKKADASGLVECLHTAMESMGIANILERESVLGVQDMPILIGCGTDGATVNISGQNGMRGQLQAVLQWLFWSWCYAHRLELACKDAVKSCLFKEIDEMLLRLYYLYEKLPKKCRELADLVVDLKEVYEFPDGGILPVRAHGSRWISHKRKAMQRVIDRYGTYLLHLTALTEDQSIKSTDRQRLKGYLQKWRKAKMIIGSALYTDMLKPAAALSLTLQDDRVNTVDGIKQILKAHESLNKLSSQDPLEWPTTKVVFSRIKTENGGKIYQGAEVCAYSDSVVTNCKQQALADLTALDEQMRARLEWSDVDFLRSILLFLDTLSWVETDDDRIMEIKSAECFVLLLKRKVWT